MRGIRKLQEPRKLAQYRASNPQGSWEDFRRGRARRNAVKDALIAQQQGLCCYCEIDLKTSVQQGEIDDFRVEHFHPKSDCSTSHNWALDWQNLLACCSGGSATKVVDSQSRASQSDVSDLDHSCDVPKQDHNWDGVILNPLNLPRHVCPFRFSRNEPYISVNTAVCEAHRIDLTQAKTTIEKLRLHSPRLVRLREEKLNKLSDELSRLTQQGIPLEHAIEQINSIYLIVNDDGHLPGFYSAMKDFLGV